MKTKKIAIIFLFFFPFITQAQQQWGGLLNQTDEIYRTGIVTVRPSTIVTTTPLPINANPSTSITNSMIKIRSNYGGTYDNQMTTLTTNEIQFMVSNPGGGGYSSSGLSSERLWVCSKSTTNQPLFISSSGSTFPTKTFKLLPISLDLETDGKIVSNSDIISRSRIIIGSNTLATPTGYKLYVEQGILTEKVKVAIKTSSDWSDFVFADTYKLRPLNEVEAFIKDNKHLPDVPSANEMVTNGLDVAKTDALLLQKIEELTLYIIQQQKEIEELKKRIK